MFRWTRCLFCLSLIVLVLAVSQAKAGSWQIVKEIPVNQACNIAGFIDDNYGVTGGYAGATYYSNNGGKDWTEAAGAQSLCRFGLEIIDEQIAFLVGVGGIWRSEDGGKAWKLVADPGIKGAPNGDTHGMYLSFPEKMTGWAASTWILGVTVDGGASFTPMEIPSNVEYISAISACSSTEGYLLDVDGKLYYTSDGGSNWTVTRLKLSEKSPMRTFPMAAMRFDKAGKGIVLTWSSKDRTWLASYTNDRGQTWSQEKIGGRYGSIYLSRDGSLATIYGAKKLTVMRRK